MDKDVCEVPTAIMAKGEAIEQMGSFEYLGSFFDNKADVTAEIKRKPAIANGKLEQFDTLWPGSNAATKL